MVLSCEQVVYRKKNRDPRLVVMSTGVVAKATHSNVELHAVSDSSELYACITHHKQSQRSPVHPDANLCPTLPIWKWVPTHLPQHEPFGPQ